jgi:hypothetical protein
VECDRCSDVRMSTCVFSAQGELGNKRPELRFQSQSCFHRCRTIRTTLYFVLGISRVKVCGTGKGRGDGKMALVT